MRKNKVLDFDKFISEKKHEYLVVKAYGKEYKVKMEAPAVVPIMLARAAEDGDANQVGLAMMKAGDIMFGKQAVDDMCEAGATIPELGALFRKVFSMISGQDIDGEDLDEAEYTDEGSKATDESKTPKK